MAKTHKEVASKHLNPNLFGWGFLVRRIMQRGIAVRYASFAISKIQDDLSFFSFFIFFFTLLQSFLDLGQCTKIA
jgi:hypothetical protein